MTRTGNPETNPVTAAPAPNLVIAAPNTNHTLAASHINPVMAGLGPATHDFERTQPVVPLATTCTARPAGNTRPLTLSLTATGSHPAAWRLSPLPPLADISALRTMARTAERKGIDLLLLGTEPAPIQLDPLPLLGALIAATETIGLCAAWSPDRTEPYHVARVLATLDHLAKGRTAWMPTMQSPDPARTREFIDVAKKLWDSWQDAAWAMEKSTGMFVDPDKVTPIHHNGEHFKVRGPLNLPRPPQGHPVIVMRDGPALHQFVTETADLILSDRPQGSALQNLLVILAETEPAAQQRAQALDALSPCHLPRFTGTPAALAAKIEKSPQGFNLMPAVLPQDLDLLPPHPAKPGTLRDRLGLQRPRSQYETRP